jgi:hypothetical protein
MFCQALLMAGVPRSNTWEQLAANGCAVIACYIIARFSWNYFEGPLLRHGQKYKY